MCWVNVGLAGAVVLLGLAKCLWREDRGWKDVGYGRF